MKTEQPKKDRKTISVVMQMHQVRAIEAIARDQHRSLSGQIAFFCANAVAQMGTSKHSLED